MASKKSAKTKERPLTEIEKAALQQEVAELAALNQQIAEKSQERQRVVARLNRIAAVVEPDEAYRVNMEKMTVEAIPEPDE